MRPPTHRTASLGLLLGLALSVVAALPGAPALVGPTTVVAAAPDLTIASDSRYEVRPDDALVRVTADLRITSHTTDTETRRYYFDRAYLAVLAGTTSFRLTGDGIAPSVRVTKRAADHTMLLLSFGTKVYSGGTLALRLTFDMPDPGGAPVRDVRVGDSVATFPVWAFATDDTPGSSVEVVFPEGFTIDVAAGKLSGPVQRSDGSLVMRSGRLAEPLAYSAYLVADREGSLVEESRTIAVGDIRASVIIRSWPDDPDFGSHTADLFERALPALGTAIGLAYPRSEPLIARESVSRTIGGYAGVFDPAKSEIAIDYAAPPFVVLHEAAHIWFNGALLADRWADEAFASYYAARVAPSLDVAVAAHDELTPELLAARIPLNAWSATEPGDDATEEFAYAATLALARAIAARAGDDALAEVWADATARRSAYQPDRLGAPPELTDGSAPDWRGLLDLLESHTDSSFTDLWLGWVVRPEERDLLHQRTEVRDAYDRVADAAGSWQLPRSIRSAMTTWRFDEAGGLLGQAEGILGRRSEVASRAVAIGLTPPTTLRELFEGDRGFRSADVEAQAELAALDALVAAAAAEPRTPDAIQSLGLIGATPDADVAAARAAFEAGELSVTVDHSEAARATWAEAGAVGTRRAAAILGAVLLVLVVVLLAVLAVRGRRHARAAVRRSTPVVVEMAHPIARGEGPAEASRPDR